MRPSWARYSPTGWPATSAPTRPTPPSPSARRPSMPAAPLALTDNVVTAAALGDAVPSADLTRARAALGQPRPSVSSTLERHNVGAHWRGDHHRRPGRGQRERWIWRSVRQDPRTVRAHHRLLPGRRTCWPGADPHGGFGEHPAPRRVGRRRAAAGRAVRAAQVWVYCARAARTVCETSHPDAAASATPGNAWRVYLRRALTSTNCGPPSWRIDLGLS